MGITKGGWMVMAAALALGACGSDSPTEPSLFRAEDIVVGTGEPAVAGDDLTVHYIGALSTGQVFQSSYEIGQPFSFRLGVGSVIRGWDQGLVGMREGGKRRLTIPPALGYGDTPQPGIPANSTLIFEIELLANATR